MALTQTQWSDMARVIDVSHWQVPDDLDWAEAVANGNVVGMIAKATQGAAGEDPAFFAHSINAYNDGVPLLGAYHFGDGADGERQAEHFVERVRRAYGEELTGLALMLDAERNASSQMSVAEAARFVKAVHAELGRWPWLYMGRDGPTGTRAGLPNTILASCPLLLPKYGSAPTDASLPLGFRMPRDSAERAGVLRAWQYTDGKIHGGPVTGLGVVDQSRFIGIGTLDEAKAIWA